MAMADQSQLEKLKRRLKDVPSAQGDDALLEDYLDDAESYILGYTRRKALPDVLKPTQVQLAVIYVNRMGTEGESAHGEGGVSRSIALLPEDQMRLMNQLRLGLTLGPG